MIDILLKSFVYKVGINNYPNKTYGKTPNLLGTNFNLFFIIYNLLISSFLELDFQIFSLEINYKNIFRSLKMNGWKL